MNWLFYAFLSAVFAALTSILAKIGIKNVDSNLATAIRTSVIIVFAWGVVLAQGTAKTLPTLSKNTWIFLVLSGLATGLSWIFYFRALQVGEASKVVPIDKLSLIMTIILAAVLLKEKITLLGWLGAGLMTAGALLLAIK
jgi:transporter family protein